MADMRVKLNSVGFRNLLTSSAIQNDLAARAAAVQRTAGVKHHDIDTQAGPNRARAAVITTTDTGKRREAVDRNLTRAFDSAR